MRLLDLTDLLQTGDEFLEYRKNEPRPGPPDQMLPEVWRKSVCAGVEARYVGRYRRRNAE